MKSWKRELLNVFDEERFEYKLIQIFPNGGEAEFRNFNKIKDLVNFLVKEKNDGIYLPENLWMTWAIGIRDLVKCYPIKRTSAPFGWGNKQLFLRIFKED